MFQDDLFTILSEEISENSADFTIRLNRSHPIYSGHFPEDAITPGVCLVQIGVDLFSHASGHEFQLVKAKNVKFLQLIRPDVHPEICFHLTWAAPEENIHAVKVLVDADTTTFIKMSLQLGLK